MSEAVLGPSIDFVQGKDKKALTVEIFCPTMENAGVIVGRLADAGFIDREAALDNLGRFLGKPEFEELYRAACAGIPVIMNNNEKV